MERNGLFLPSRILPLRSVKQRTRQLRISILGIYAAIITILALGLLYSLRSSWLATLDREREALMRHASSTSALLRESMIDGSKILDVAQSMLGKAFSESSLTRYQAHQILRSVMENFSIYNTTDTMGLLLLLDNEGRLLARHGEYPCPAYDLSDRGYFQDLKADPSRKFAMGRLRIARTTGKPVFHLSMPVRGKRGELRAVIALQFQQQEIVNSVRHILSGTGDRILFMLPTGEVAFLFPPDKAMPLPEDPLNRQLLTLINQRQQEKGWIRIEGGTGVVRETICLGYMKDPVFGLITTAILPQSDILARFRKQNRFQLLMSLLGFLTISGIFFSLYRKAIRLEHAFLAASLDHMTMIGNRRALEAELDRLWRDSVRRGRPISLLFMDIDRFKEFNDTHGHAAGDRVLKATAQVIRGAMQRPLDFCGRWGGEEFVAVLPETTEEEASAVAERIRTSARKMRIKSRGVILPEITLSIGIACSGPSTASPMDLIDRADRAMLQAKEAGRDRVVCSRKTDSLPV